MENEPRATKPDQFAFHVTLWWEGHTFARVVAAHWAPKALAVALDSFVTYINAGVPLDHSESRRIIIDEADLLPAHIAIYVTQDILSEWGCVGAP